jgi:hypothetical protein
VTDLVGLEAVRAEAEARLGALDAEGDDDDEKKDAEDDEKDEARPAAADGPEADARAVALQIGDAALDEAALTYSRARNCLEELAGLGNMRRPVALEPWAAPVTERRLLARVDAIVACGQDVLPRLVREIEDRPIPDPELTWALVFLFGSLSGGDAVDQVVRLVLSADLDAPDMLLFVADALALAPSPALERPLRAWLDPARPPALRAAALAALGRRRLLGFGDAAAAADDADKRVALAATRALGFTSGGMDASVLDQQLRHKDPDIVRAALVSALQLRCRLGLERARDLTATGKGDVADAALFLGVVGDADAWEPLAAAARKSPTPGVLEALGWFGSLRAVEILLDVLEGKDKEAKSAAAAALHRLTGAGLADEEKEDKKDGDADAAAAAAAPPRRPSARDADVDDEAPPPPPPKKPEEPKPLGGPFEKPVRVAELSTKPERWGDYWQKVRPTADPTRRHRFGHFWSPEDPLWELDDDISGSGDRELAHLELVARTGADVPIDLSDFVSRQRQRIADLRAHAARAGARGGDWPVRLSR